MTRNVEHDSHPLIEPLSTGAAPPIPSDLPLETAFLAGGQGGLHLETQGRTRALKTHFAHAVARTPGDLRLHVQRLLLHADTRDPAILGALCDLFRVLKDRGAPLRRRMLALARPLLSCIDHKALRLRLERCTRVHTPSPARTQESVLDTGITGTTRLIARLSPQQTSGEDPLDSARQQLESGQTELAQETLEWAVRTDPARLDLHLSLLEIYRQVRDRHHIEAVWQSLQGMENPAVTEWRRLLSQLEEEA